MQPATVPNLLERNTLRTARSPHDLLLHFGRASHARQHRFDVVDGFVNDAVVADIDPVILDRGARSRVAAHVERNDRALERPRG